ncbi:MAG: hypothetical protein V4461_15535 [Pseudomonadota bacterium]
MKSSFKKFGLALGGLLIAGIAIAQITTAPLVTSINSGDAFLDIPNGQTRTTTVYASAAQLQAWILGGNSTRTGKPVLTSCITGGGTIAGTDNAFVLTGGSTASTSCVATFSQAYLTRPVCTVSSETAYATTTPSFAVSTTAVTITQASNSSEVYDVICMAQPGG